MKYTILIDNETDSRREEEFALAQRLSAVELARFYGTKDLSIEEFEKNMLEAISQKMPVHSFRY